MENRIKAVASARGERPFDLAITNVHLINVLTREIYPADIGITGERIACVQCAGISNLSARQIIDGQELWAAPGFIDGHVHNESSMCTPARWAEVILPKGTTTVITDPHEIANVLGTRGVKYMLDASVGLPLRYYISTPSCVPSVPELESSGAVFTENEIREMLSWERVIAIAEAMDFIGLANQVGSITSIVNVGLQAGIPIEGHGPGLSGRILQAYLTAAGPRSSDHESLDCDNMREKVLSGAMVYARVSSFLNAANELARAINNTPDPRMFGLCTDDIHPEFLLQNGHMDHGMRTLIAAGVDPLVVFQMASINVARHYGLWDLGAIAPGWLADIVLLDDLEQVHTHAVITGGKLRVEGGRLLEPIPQPIAPLEENSVHLPEGLSVEAFIPRTNHKGNTRFNAINLSNLIDTCLEVVEVPVEKGQVKFPLPDGLALAAVVGRHGQGIPPSLAFIKGFPIQKGAIASTVSHDSHNLVVISTNPGDILTATQSLAEFGGGLVAINNGLLLASIRLPIAGLMSPLSLEQIASHESAFKTALTGLGLPRDATAALLLLTLPVIPQVRLTDRGLVDVINQRIIPLEAV